MRSPCFHLDPLRRLAGLTGACVMLWTVWLMTAPLSSAQDGTVETIQRGILTVRLAGGLTVRQGTEGRVRATVNRVPQNVASLRVQSVNRNGGIATCSFRASETLRGYLRRGLPVVLAPDGIVRLGTLSVSSNVERARVTINGRLQETAPHRYDLWPGTYTVLVSKDGYDTYQEQQRIASGETVRLSVTLRELPPPPPPPQTGILVVQSEPSGATVWIGDRDVGRTPRRGVQLPPGSHRVRLSRRDYVTVDTTVVVSVNAQATLSVTLRKAPVRPDPSVLPDSTLPPDADSTRPEPTTPDPLVIERPPRGRAGLVVRSIPDSAQVYVNEEFRGDTPFRLNVEPGRVILRIERQYHRDLTDTLDLEAGRVVPEEYDLEPIRGSLVVTVGPWGSNVFADDQPLGRTPLSEDITKGYHRIHVERPGFVPFDTTVLVHEGLPAVVDATLRRDAGWLRIHSDVAGADVTLDGVLVGQAPLNLRVPSDTFDVVVQRGGVQLYRGEIAIATGQDTTVSAGGSDPPSHPLVPDDTASASDLIALGYERMLAGEYTDARALFLRAQQLEPSNLDVARAIGIVEPLLAQINSLSPTERAELSTLRNATHRNAVEGNGVQFRETARRLLNLVPDDLAVLALYPKAFARVVSKAGGPELSFAYVYGSSERPLANPPFELADAPPPTGFLLSETEVTNAHFAAFLNAAEDERDEDGKRLAVQEPRGIEREDRRSEWRAKAGMEELPTTDATWYGAQAYAAWVGGRLPNPAEWMWAAALGMAEGGVFIGNFSGTGGLDTWEVVAPAAELPADGLGLHGLTGNVYEWADAPAQRQGGVERRRVLGGSWRMQAPTPGQPPHDSTADVNDPEDHLGFRVLLSAE